LNKKYINEDVKEEDESDSDENKYNDNDKFNDEVDLES
jgi:hypothetical protein